MDSSTFRRWIAVLTFALFGASMAFLVGARAGAALNGHVNGVTFANAHMPRIQSTETTSAVIPLANNVSR